METLHTQVVIVGAGLTGSILANKLSQAGVRVLLVDYGEQLFFDPETGEDQRQPIIDRLYASTSRPPNGPYVRLNKGYSGPQMPVEDNLGEYYQGPAYAKEPTGDTFKSTYTRVVGGTTWHWLGTCLRYLPSTFKEKTLFNRGADWPIGYEDLERWYWEAEREIGVAGDDAVTPEIPRFGRSFPMPLILPSYSDRRIAERWAGLSFEGHPVRVESTPQARNSIPYQGRPPCAGSVNCVPLCPIQAKYDATVHLKRAINPRLDPENKRDSVPAKLLIRTAALRLETGAGGKITGLVVKRLDLGTDQRIEAKQYILTTHGIEIPRLLFYSKPGVGGQRGGLANSSGLVGRYLMDHNIRIAYGVADEPMYPFRGPLSTSGVESLRDGAFRRHRGAFRVEIENIGANWALNAPFGDVKALVAQGLYGKKLDRKLAWRVGTQVQLDALIEPEAQFDSNVSLSDVKDPQTGVPLPKVSFVIDDYTKRGAAAFEVFARQALKALGSSDEDVKFADGFFPAGHVMGTCRMGDDPLTSVADSYGRTHDHPNLHITGSALFPTVDAANPTLTIVALTLRAVDNILKSLHH